MMRLERVVSLSSLIVHAKPFSILFRSSCHFHIGPQWHIMTMEYFMCIYIYIYLYLYINNSKIQIYIYICIFYLFIYIYSCMQEKGNNLFEVTTPLVARFNDWVRDGALHYVCAGQSCGGGLPCLARKCNSRSS